MYNVSYSLFLYPSQNTKYVASVSKISLLKSTESKPDIPSLLIKCMSVTNAIGQEMAICIINTYSSLGSPKHYFISYDWCVNRFCDKNNTWE